VVEENSGVMTHIHWSKNRAHRRRTTPSNGGVKLKESLFFRPFFQQGAMGE
jgi:hypothetical protein